MTKEQKKMRLAKAKHTRFGRFLCRLMGDEAGQTLMEYVVLGVLVVSAVVAIVIAFSDGLQNRFTVMLQSIFGHTQEAANTTTTGAGQMNTNISNANDIQDTITGGGE